MTPAERAADELLRLNGPHTPDRIRAAAATVGELVRRLNHATRSNPFEWPGELDATVASLAGAVHGLNQLCDQLAANLSTFTTDPALYTTADRPRGLVVKDAREILVRAAAIARQLGQNLDAARRLTNTLGITPGADYTEADQ